MSIPTSSLNLEIIAFSASDDESCEDFLFVFVEIFFLDVFGFLCFSFAAFLDDFLAIFLLGLGGTISSSVVSSVLSSASSGSGSDSDSETTSASASTSTSNSSSASPTRATSCEMVIPPRISICDVEMWSSFFNHVASSTAASESTP